jgi:hypothetical protein
VGTSQQAEKEGVVKKYILLALTILFLVPTGTPQKSKQITLTDKSDIPTSDILRGFQKYCPNVTITNDLAKSDYTIEAVKKDRLYHHCGFTLFDHDGKAIYSTETAQVSNAVKNVCQAINGLK